MLGRDASAPHRAAGQHPDGDVRHIALSIGRWLHDAIGRRENARDLEHAHPRTDAGQDG
jgi:hypothetical protein